MKTETRHWRLLTGEFWLVVAVPTTLPPYVPETDVSALTNEDAAFEALREWVPEKFGAMVIHFTSDGKREDVSRKFAERWINLLIAQGESIDKICERRFLDSYFPESWRREIEQSHEDEEAMRRELSSPERMGRI